MNLATATEASIGNRTLNSIHLGGTRLWLRPTWPTIAELPGGPFASPLSLSATTAAVRSYSSVVLYDISADTFSPRGQPIVGEEGMSPYASLSADGNTVVAGWTGPTATPSVKVFDFVGTDWVQRGETLTSSTQQFSSFGTKTAISDDKNKIVISESANNRGQIKTYIWSGTTWQEQDSYLGEASTYFGIRTSLSLSADGLTLAADSPEVNANGWIDSGLVRIFTWSGTGWTPSQDISGDFHLQHLGGGGVGISGNKLIIGIPEYRNAGTPMVGKVVVYEKNAGTFTEHSSILGTSINVIGKFASIHGNRVLFSTGKGHICYDISTVGWTQVGAPFQAFLLYPPQTLIDKALVMNRRETKDAYGRPEYHYFVSLKRP